MVFFGSDTAKVKDVIWLSDLNWGYRSARILHLANRLKLFTAIASQSVSLKEVCQLLNTNEAMTEKVLIALCAMDLLEKDGAKYRNSEIADTYLVKGKPLYQGDIIAHSDYVRRYWENLEDQICKEPLGDVSEDDEHRHFIMGMDNLAASGRVEFFLKTIDLKGRKKLLDVGGGPGSYSIAACEKYPQLKATVFDLPATVSIAKEVIERDGMGEQVSVCAADWDKDDFPAGFDVVMFSNVLHGAESNTEMKLSKAYAAMEQGGVLLVQEFLLNDEKTGPEWPALFNVMVGAYSKSEILEVITKAGFTGAKVVGEDQQLGATWVTATR